jgi:hypothetical protein
LHDAQAQTSNDDAMRNNFVKYGRRLEQIAADLTKQREQPAA